MIVPPRPPPPLFPPSRCHHRCATNLFFLLFFLSSCSSFRCSCLHPHRCPLSFSHRLLEVPSAVVGGALHWQPSWALLRIGNRSWYDLRWDTQLQHYMWGPQQWFQRVGLVSSMLLFHISSIIFKTRSKLAERSVFVPHFLPRSSSHMNIRLHPRSPFPMHRPYSLPAARCHRRNRDLGFFMQIYYL